MHIGFVSTEYITETEFAGGLANYLFRTAKALASRGHDIEIFTLSDNNAEFIHEGIRVHRIKNKSSIFSLLNSISRYKFKRSIRFLSLSYCLRRKLLSCHQENPFDVIQVTNCFACGIFFSFGIKIPVIVRVSSYEPLFRKYYRIPLTMDQKICEWLETLALKRLDGVYAPSRFMANILREKGINADVIRPIFYINTYISEESIYKKYLDGKKYLFFFGAIGYLKGCYELAKVLPKLFAKYPDIHFACAGEILKGPDGNDMLNYIKLEAGEFACRVHYLGVLRYPQLYPIIKKAHAIILPSLIDNLPNTMLEAMAFGKVVVGSKGVSFDEFIEDKISGFLVSPSDINSLFETIDKVINLSEEQILKIGQKAADKISQLRPEITAPKLENYFNKFILNKKITV